jgi:lipid A 3-O-deacylase
MNRRTAGRLALFLFWLAGGVASGARRALAQATDGGAASPPQPASVVQPERRGIWEGKLGDGFRRGIEHSGFGFGFGIGTHALGSKRHHDLALSMVRLGWMLTGPGAGDRWGRGNLELLGELWGGAQLHPRRRSVFGFTPLLRYNFATGGRWVPFVDGGVGGAYTNIGAPDLSNGFQFNIQLGAGAHYFLRGTSALTLQYRWLHLSNAGLNVPNSGLNTHLVFVGLEQFF